MLQVDEQINRVKALYQQVTGTEAPAPKSTYAPIPPETDAEGFVRENLTRLEQALHGLTPRADAAAPTNTMPLPTVNPPLNVWANDQEWRCTVDLPGVEKDQVTVQVSQGVLHIEAVRHVPGNNGHRVVHLETGPCRYVRDLPLAPYSKTDTAEAKLECGVLHVRIQRDPAASHKNVTVTVG